MRKYELTDQKIILNGHELRRIRAVRDFDLVEKGDLGGYVESEENLSHDGDCWIYGNAAVFEHGWVRENAIISNHAVVRGNAIVRGNAWIGESFTIEGDAIIAGDVKIIGRGHMSSGNVCGDAFSGNVRRDTFGGNVLRDASGRSAHGDFRIYGDLVICNGKTPMSCKQSGRKERSEDGLL